MSCSEMETTAFHLDGLEMRADMLSRLDCEYAGCVYCCVYGGEHMQSLSLNISGLSTVGWPPQT